MSNNNTTPITCVCDECNKDFKESELIEQYSAPEYQGASVHQESVSPCCFADWDYADDGEYADNPGGYGYPITNPEP